MSIVRPMKDTVCLVGCLGAGLESASGYLVVEEERAVCPPGILGGS